MPQKLNYKVLGEGEPLVILHGLFGSSDNWFSIAKTIGDNYRVYLPDARNHGDSFHSSTFTYEAMAQDLLQFLNEHDLDAPVLIGHSMGGKTAMRFVADHPERISKLVVVDIAPKYYPVHHRTILDGLQAINLHEIGSRSDADKQLASYIPQRDVRQFLLKNLSRNEDGNYVWKLNLEAIDNNIEDVGAGLEEKPATDKPVLFIKGATSDYIQNGDEELIRTIFPDSEIRTIANAGHWVHAEQPEAFLKELLDFIEN